MSRRDEPRTYDAPWCDTCGWRIVWKGNRWLHVDVTVDPTRPCGERWNVLPANNDQTGHVPTSNGWDRGEVRALTGCTLAS